jgi:hypothetical protein
MGHCSWEQELVGRAITRILVKVRPRNVGLDAGDEGAELEIVACLDTCHEPVRTNSQVARQGSLLHIDGQHHDADVGQLHVIVGPCIAGMGATIEPRPRDGLDRSDGRTQRGSKG